MLCRPHSRKEAKFDSKTKLYQLNEMAGKIQQDPNRVVNIATSA